MQLKYPFLLILEKTNYNLMDHLIGKTFSRYKVVRQIGSGGMGVLYLADDIELNRKVVLKFLPADMINDPDINLRFNREAQTAGSLSHPNIVTIYDVGVHENKTFIAMEYVEGKTLRELIKSDELTIDRITDISVQIGEGLNEAHSKGITHRDIKPENILIDEKGKVKIVDFGLAKVKNVSKELTKESSTLGTIKYMSPEQIRNQKVDHRTDIWSFGVILYEMITGKYPFKGEHDASVFYSVINQTPEPLARFKAEVSEEFQRIIDKTLDKEPETRYQHIDELLSDLRRVSKNIKSSKSEVRKKSRKTILFIAPVLFIIIVLSVYYFLNNPSKVIIPSKHTQITYAGNIYIYIAGAGMVGGGFYRDLAKVSPDGQFTAFVIEKEEEKVVYLKDNSGEKIFEIFNGIIEAFCLQWSPDGKEILLSCMLPDSKIVNFIIPKFGGQSRLIDKQLVNTSWSPDGTLFAGISFEENYISIINKETLDTVSTLKLKGNFNFLHEIEWASAGNRIAFLTYSSDSKNYTLWTIKTNGTQQKQITKSEKKLFSPRWSSDGRNLYYLQESSGTRDLVKINISSEGDAVGEPKIIVTGLDAYGFSLTQNNKLLTYTKNLNYSNLWKIEYKDKGQVPQLQQLTEGRTLIKYPSISPDNKKIAFINNGEVCVENIEDRNIERLTFMGLDFYKPAWSRNNKQIAVSSDSKLTILSTKGGVKKIIKDTDIGGQLSWVTDSTILCFNSTQFILYNLNIKTEEKETLISNKNFEWMFNLFSSPNTKQIVFYWQPSNFGVWLFNMENSSKKILANGRLLPLQWAADEKHVYLFDYLKKGIIKISTINGVIKEFIKIPFKGINALNNDIDITTDGKTIVCAVPEFNSDIWMIENFDPEVE
ncbi:MAG: serine/threonine-protein kinase [Ignavibacteriales bacterium]|nr:MAG: serine/threonine-protein kinase [Ignavibacteriales bacterium]